MAPHIHQNGGGYDISQKRTIFSERELPRAFCFVDSTEMSGANPNIIAGEDEDDWNVSPFFFARKGSPIYQLLIQYGGKGQ